MLPIFEKSVSQTIVCYEMLSGIREETLLVERMISINFINFVLQVNVQSERSPVEPLDQSIFTYSFFKVILRHFCQELVDLKVYPKTSFLN